MGVRSGPEDTSPPFRAARTPVVLLAILGLWACETPFEPGPPPASSSDRPTASRRGDAGGDKGGGHGTAGNNLSFPLIWSDGVELALRGTEGLEQFQGPYFVAGGRPWFVQDDPGNEWQADNVNAVTEGVGRVTVDVVDWGDNLEAKSWPHGSQVRVETVLYEELATPMTAYDMQARDPSVSGPAEVWGTSGDRYPSDVATVYSGMARLVIQKLTRERDAPDLALTWNPAEARWTGDAAEPVFSGEVWAASEGRGGYSAEINVQGKVIYGYNWVTDATGDGPGDYRITFVLDEANSSLSSPNTGFDGATAIAPREEDTAVQAEGGEPDLGGGTAAVAPEHDLTYIDVRLSEGESGQVGQGSGGSGGPPDRGKDSSPGDDGSDGDPGDGDGSPDDEGDAPDDGDEPADEEGEVPSDRGSSSGGDGERRGDRAGPGEDESSTSGIGNRRARGDLTALWVGCPDAEKKGGGHGGPGESGGCGGCSGEHDEAGGSDDHGDHEDEPCTGDHEEDEDGCGNEHEDGDSCSGAHDGGEPSSGSHAGGADHPGGKYRPATHFHLRFDVRDRPAVGGDVELTGIGDDAGVQFGGRVRWIVEGRRSHELFFGGELAEAVVGRSCFLFSVQDNGRARSGPQEPDRLQYRLYGNDTGACSAPPPDHLPKGYPIALQEGFLRVAEPPTPRSAGSPASPRR